MKYRLMFLMFCIQGFITCSVFSQQGSHGLDDVESNYILKKYGSIYTELSASVFSKDSIMIKTTFINHSGKDFYLYKPLIPSKEFNKKRVFAFDTDDDTALWRPMGFRPSIMEDYKMDTGQYYPVIAMPVKMDKENFLLLPSSDSLSFTINIANFYDLQSIMNMDKRLRRFSIVYGSITPLVVDSFQQVYQFEKNTVNLKPVCIIVGMQEAGKNTRTLTKRLYFTVGDN